MINRLLSILIAIFGVCLLYLGIWVMFVGGIVEIINAVQVHPVQAYHIAFGIAKILFFEFPVWLGVVALFFGLKNLISSN